MGKNDLHFKPSCRPLLRARFSQKAGRFFVCTLVFSLHLTAVIVTKSELPFGPSRNANFVKKVL